MARPGLEPGTPRFSVVQSSCLNLAYLQGISGGFARSVGFRVFLHVAVVCVGKGPMARSVGLFVALYRRLARCVRRACSRARAGADALLDVGGRLDALADWRSTTPRMPRPCVVSAMTTSIASANRRRLVVAGAPHQLRAWNLADAIPNRSRADMLTCATCAYAIPDETADAALFAMPRMGRAITPFVQLALVRHAASALVADRSSKAASRLVRHVAAASSGIRDHPRWVRRHAALMPFTVDKGELARYASGLGREVAADLDGALGWFGAHEDGPSVDISRYDLQQFVHYTLPRKYLADVEEHIAVVGALGDALERLGAPAEYVDLCRSPETIALLRLWAVDEDAAFAQFAAFADASGLEPPDVEELQWQGVMGLAEARTREAATLALERALEAGDMRPAAEIVRAVLAEPDPDGEYRTRLLAVQGERIDRWAGSRFSSRRGLLGPLVGDLIDARLPEWPADDVLDWLLDEARSGLALTERGALSRALCVEVARRRPGWTWGKPPRSEADIENLRSLHAALRGSGLVRRRGRKLLATKRAGELAPGARRVCILESLLGGESFVSAVAELTLAALAQDAPDARVRVAETIDDAGWRSDGGPLPNHAVPSTMTDVRRVLWAIGAAEGDPLSRSECTLTARGGAAVLCALRAQALHPPPLPGPSSPP